MAICKLEVERKIVALIIVLCRQTGDMFREKTGAFRKVLKKQADFGEKLVEYFNEKLIEYFKYGSIELQIPKNLLFCK